MVSMALKSKDRVAKDTNVQCIIQGSDIHVTSDENNNANSSCRTENASGSISSSSNVSEAPCSSGSTLEGTVQSTDDSDTCSFGGGFRR